MYNRGIYITKQLMGQSTHVYNELHINKRRYKIPN